MSLPGESAEEITPPSETTPAAEQQTNRDLIFKGAEAPPPTEPVSPPAANIAEETPPQETEFKSTQEEQETPEVSGGFDMINLGEPQEQRKEEGQKGSQVDEITALKEQNSLLTRLINQIQGEKDSTVQTPQSQQPEAKKKPEFKDYEDNKNLGDKETMAKYAEDLAAWQSEQTINAVLDKREAEESVKKRNNEDQQLRESFNGGIPDAEKRYNNKFSSSLINSNVKMSADLTREVLGAAKNFNSPGLSHDMMYHLSNRDDVVELLAGSSPTRAGAILGDIARKIIHGKAAHTKKITEAPKPISIVRPGARTKEAPSAGGTPVNTLISRKGGQRHR